MNRTESLNDIAGTIEEMIRRYGHRKDITVTFEKLTEEGLRRFRDFQRMYFALRAGEEYFFVWEPDGLLYVVPITGDSLLTAAYELMDLVFRKF